MEHGFASDFTLGAEEELFLVEPPEHGLKNDATRVLEETERSGSWEADHEAFASEVELRSAPEGTPTAVLGALRDARRAVAATGATLMGAGLHPTAAFGDVELVQKQRYARVEDEVRGLIRRTPECALHIHVGVPDLETAVRVFNGLRGWLPLIEALGANSPWWHGIDSGMASARAAIVRSYPSRGIPRPLRDGDDYQEALAAVAAGGGPRDYTLIWWDVRLHPKLGTVEVRELDVQSRLEDMAALAALVQGLARLEAEPGRQPAPTEAIAASAFNAARDGLDAHLLTDGRLRPAREAARLAVASARSYSPEPEALDGIERIVREGGGADRRRAAYGRGGVQAMLEELVGETAA
ncbi:MAG TPA: YbdK family carboxylate-amine ligase [Thermoleophilaceae bacterium]|jgi:carboxylate-amine ligase